MSDVSDKTDAAALVAAARGTAGPIGSGSPLPQPGSLELLLCGAFAVMHAVCARGSEAYDDAMAEVISGIHRDYGAYPCVLADGKHVCLLRGAISEAVSSDGKINLDAGPAVPVALAIDELVRSAEAVFQAPPGASSQLRKPLSVGAAAH